MATHTCRQMKLTCTLASRSRGLLLLEPITQRNCTGGWLYSPVVFFLDALLLLLVCAMVCLSTAKCLFLLAFRVYCNDHADGVM